MTELSADPQRVPRIEENDQVEAGTVCVLTLNQAENLDPQLQAGIEVVLETKDGGRLELTTAAEAKGAQATGTYLNGADYAALGTKRQDPTVRRYRKFRDTWRKAWSKKGATLLLTTALGLILAVSGVWFTFFSESGTSTAAVAERAQILMQWVAAPVQSASGKPAGDVVASREARAQQCLTTLRGGEAAVERVHGVDCKTKSPSVFHDKETAAALSGVLGLITALIGLLGVGAKFGFGKNPD